jgi:hypothetical protein
MMIHKLFAGVVLMFATLVASVDVEVSNMFHRPKMQFGCISLFLYTAHLPLTSSLLLIRWTFLLAVWQMNARLAKTTTGRISMASVTPQYTFLLARRAKTLFVTIASIDATNFTRTNSHTTILIRGGFCVIRYLGSMTADVAPALLDDTASQKADVFWTKWCMSVHSGCKMKWKRRGLALEGHGVHSSVI